MALKCMSIVRTIKIYIYTFFEIYIETIEHREEWMSYKKTTITHT